MSASDFQDRDDNLTFALQMFFNSAIGFAASSPEWTRSTPITYSLGTIETGLWLKLGTELGVFDARGVTETLTTLEPALSTAWKLEPAWASGSPGLAPGRKTMSSAVKTATGRWAGHDQKTVRLPAGLGDGGCVAHEL